MFFSFFKLRKCRTVLKNSLKLYRKKKQNLSSLEVYEIQEVMEKLQGAILSRNASLASNYRQKLEKIIRKYFKKSLFHHLYEMVTAIGFALIIAVIIRQTWFEPYEIPSGSMRPTFKEQDRLVVSKTQFGINFPLKASHLLFDPNEVERGGIVTFTGENMPISDVKTRYFYIFPGNKQYIKRIMGLSGDTLYFYGGKLYGIDKNGRDISNYYQKNHFDRLEYIPFIHLEGKSISPKSGTKGTNTPIFIHQMNIPIAKISTVSKTDSIKQLLVSPKSSPVDKQTQFDIHDLWGMGNYATARLLTQNQLFDLYHPLPINYKRTNYYLELTHHANLSHAKVQEDLLGRSRPILGSYTSIIPLEDQHIQKMWNNMYTARFIVKNGYAKRYGLNEAYATSYHSFLPKLRGSIPDGTYELQYGKAYEVKWQGLTKELPNSHPLSQFDPERFYTLFNVGMELDIRFIPQYFQHTLAPARYAYFRHGDLYLLGAPIFSKDDPILQEFVKTEQMKSASGYYKPFIDEGAPIKPDGTLDRAKIEKFGLTIPDNYYLALGDNHAMSADSRDFGFVPKGNIRGAPSFIFWASGSRYGYPNQLPYAIFTTPRIIVWSIAIVVFTLWSLFTKKQFRLPIDFKKE